jgi:hypothetical protein
VSKSRHGGAVECFGIAGRGGAVERFGIAKRCGRAFRNRKAGHEISRLEGRGGKFAPGCPIDMLSPNNDENLGALSTDNIEML